MRWIQARLSVKMVRCGGIVACCEACMRVAVMAANSARVIVLDSLFPPGLTTCGCVKVCRGVGVSGRRSRLSEFVGRLWQLSHQSNRLVF